MKALQKPGKKGWYVNGSVQAPAARPSTRAGDAMAGAMTAAAYVMDYALPLALISAYRLIPGGTRGRVFGGPSASLNAVRALRAAGSGGWQVIRIAAKDNGGYHPDR